METLIELSLPHAEGGAVDRTLNDRIARLEQFKNTL